MSKKLLSELFLEILDKSRIPVILEYYKAILHGPKETVDIIIKELSNYISSNAILENPDNKVYELIKDIKFNSELTIEEISEQVAKIMQIEISKDVFNKVKENASKSIDSLASVLIKPYKKGEYEGSILFDELMADEAFKDCEDDHIERIKSIKPVFVFLADIFQKLEFTKNIKDTNDEIRKKKLTSYIVTYIFYIYDQIKPADREDNEKVIAAIIFNIMLVPHLIDFNIVSDKYVFVTDEAKDKVD